MIWMKRTRYSRYHQEIDSDFLRNDEELDANSPQLEMILNLNGNGFIETDIDESRTEVYLNITKQQQVDMANV